MSRKGLREIPWGISEWDSDEICIYDNGRIAPVKFLQSVRELQNSSVPQNAREALTAGDVNHSKFRPMSPTEARRWGADTGVLVADKEHKGYPVTYVIL